ncbi:hypothetical protein IFM89_011633 [Coptis chinensis]|uniref:Cyclic nucleotide-binding domain-containing protein n=1 Tax=Coptis chinensis TaxID=261450 RepID=A0A835M9Q7_9MAGN|nr:hypothetical protein IFM89_011633 [Coptis chinensis]
MLESSFKTQWEKEKFLRLDDWESRLSFTSEMGMDKFGFNIFEFLGRIVGRRSSTDSSFRKGGLKSLRRSIKDGVLRVVFPEDLKSFEKKIFDPQEKFLQIWNKFFVMSCIIAVSVDPLFFYLPFVHESNSCMGIDRILATRTTAVRTIVDAFYVIHIIFQFRTAYVAPSSKVFGRGELVIDYAQIAKRYLRKHFTMDLLSVLPLPQIAIWRYLIKGTNVLATKQALLHIVLLQYIPRFYRILPLSKDLRRNVGLFVESSFVSATIYLLLYILSSHIVGAIWYLLAIERNDTCWQKACYAAKNVCSTKYLYCGDHHVEDSKSWRNVSEAVLKKQCSPTDDNPFFNFGIYQQALESSIVANSNDFSSKYSSCLWWGLQNLSTLGQGLQPSTFPGEVIFCILLAIFGLVLFALLIGNMQTLLQSLSLRIEEMRLKKRDSEQWMHHRSLPQEIRERVRRYDQYKWLETRGVDEEGLVQNLPKDLRRDIKRHLCLDLVKRVPLFEDMDERLLDAICERLKPSLYTEKTFIAREEDPVNEMLFIINGQLESRTTDGGRIGFLNKSYLKQGDFCGEELLTWALDPKSASNLPSSTRTVRALTEVEAFALTADDMKFFAIQFRRLHSRQVQDTFRFYSQQWRTWAACFLQAAWRRRCKRKVMELSCREEEMLAEDGDVSVSSSNLGAAIYASRFATNALRGVHRLRSTNSVAFLLPAKPQEPDFSENPNLL